MAPIASSHAKSPEVTIPPQLDPFASELAPRRKPTKQERRNTRRKPAQWKAIDDRQRAEVAAARRRNHAELNPGRPLAAPPLAAPTGLVVSAGKQRRPR